MAFGAWRVLLAINRHRPYIISGSRSLVSQRKEDDMAEVKWIKDMEAALSLAKSEGKPLLLDFFNPN